MSEQSINAEGGTPRGLESLLANPELLRTLGSVIGGLSKASSEPTDTDTESTPAAALPAPPPQSADGLSSLLSNPEMMEKLPSIMAALGPMLASRPSNPTAPPQKPGPSNDRDRLLLSLKPFLSPARCEAIDTMIRIAGLGQVLQQMNQGGS